jgi:hypothetical protein
LDYHQSPLLDESVNLIIFDLTCKEEIKKTRELYYYHD